MIKITTELFWIISQHTNPEELSCQIFLGGSLKSRITNFFKIGTPFQYAILINNLITKRKHKD